MGNYVATLREELTARIAAVKAKCAAEVAELEDSMAKGGNVIDQDFEGAKAWISALVEKVRKDL